MRVISQDGTFDMPYEMSIIWCEDDGAVFLQPIGETGEYRNFATYSTEEKAKKAMEMLREKYLTRMELDGGFDHVNKVYVQPNYWVLPKVFQFPAEEELE